MQPTFKVRKNHEWLVIALQRVYEGRLKKATGAERLELRRRINDLRATERDFAWKYIDQLEKKHAGSVKGGQVAKAKARALMLDVERLWYELKLIPEKNRSSVIAVRLEKTLPTVHNKLIALEIKTKKKRKGP